MGELAFLHEVVFSRSLSKSMKGASASSMVWPCGSSFSPPCADYSFLAGVGGSSPSWRWLLQSPKILFMVDELAQVYGVFAWRGKCARGF